MANYLRYLFIATLLLTVSIAGLNWATDPFAIWHNNCVEGVNCRKTEAGDKIYLTKAYQWHHVQPEVVIMGNSRTELGLNPLSRYFGDKQVYNLSIRGASATTQITYLINMLESHQPERIILSIDFLDFLQTQGSQTQWPPRVDKKTRLPLTIEGEANPYYYLNNVRNRLHSLLALNSTLASLKTLASQRQVKNYITAEGFNQADGFVPIVNYEGINALFEQKEQDLISWLTDKPFTLTDANERSASFNSLALLIDTLSRRNIKLDLFISPYHERYLYILNRTGLFDLYLAWKSEIVKRLAGANFFTNNTLLDFSGFNRYTGEKIPTGRGFFMDWYWEPAHYRAELGDIIIQHLISDNREFELTPANLGFRTSMEKDIMDKYSKEISQSPH